ncbi:G-protein coupled receptor dmsr-1-like [Hylaeus volcanicus]|uniref:G-protein coupled receptor dmsr-1-like n=1 Tax=Hylaeus volcanicus TaxID=313075 RepID=UPI0023B82F48|nr:G-protein coupled receptor dmsr-1-like [Hylaeus volcanicus]
MTFNDSSTDYVCNLSSFHSHYSHAHGWISLLVCIFGSIANILNILVLTRREMRSPTNLILTGLAVADLFVMIDYIPFSIHIYLYRRSRRDTFTYGWASFVLFHSLFSQVCHTIAICLTLILGVWRYVAVARPQKTTEWCSYKRTTFAILTAYVFCPVLCVPLYITTKVREQVEILDSDGMSIQNTNLTDSSLVNGTNTTLYFVKLTDTAQNHNILEELNFWIYSIVIKLFPCFVLTIVILKLVQVLLQVKRRRRTLTNCKNIHMKNLDGMKCIRRMKKERQTDRTTMMLLVVLLLFLLTEFPQGILGLLSVLLGRTFFQTCYMMLDDLMDTLALVNSAINFILYCTMSRQFRKTFNELLCKNWKIPRNDGKQIVIKRHKSAGPNNTVTQVTLV